MSAPQTPLPRPTALSKPFWDACRAGKLTVQKHKLQRHSVTALRGAMQ